MKKTISIIAFAILLTASTAFAQKQLYVGASGAFINSWMTNQNNYGLPFEMDYAIKVGGVGNVNIGFDFSKNIGLKIEAGYGVLGQKYKDEYQDTVYTRTIQLNYLQFPLLFKFRSNGEVARFYIMAGPQFNLLMSAKQKYYKNEMIYNEYLEENIAGKPVKIGEETVTDRYNSLDVMARIDFGVDISLGSNFFLSAGITTAYGLTDVNATDFQIPDYSSGEYNPTHNLYGGINCGINYIIPIGGK